MINYEPYEQNDQHWVDKDPDNKQTYVIDITDEMVKNAVIAISVTAPNQYRMTITKGPTLETDLVDGVNRTYVKYQVTGPTPITDQLPDDAHVTVRVVADGDGDDFDYTVYFKPVSK